MAQRSLRQKLIDRDGFVICVELTGGPGYNFKPVAQFLRDARDAATADWADAFDFSALTFPQNPGGTPNIEPTDALFRLQKEDLLGALDYVPHLTCKDHNVAGLTSALATYRSADIEALLVMTGDKPIGAQGVFELDSIGALQLVTRFNRASLLGARPDALDQAHQFFPAAAVSCFKYTEAGQMQQYYKLEKKIAAGARFFITQVGWDWRKSQELFRYLREQQLDVPVLGNVFLLSTQTPAPRLMHDAKLAGCFVSDALFAQVQRESVSQHIERAAQQIAMYRDLGAAGVDIAGVHDYPTFTRLLERAAQIGASWQEHQANLHWPPAGGGFYRYDEDGRPVPLSQPPKPLKQKFFNGMHRALLDPDHRGFHGLKKVMSALGAEKADGRAARTFNSTEKWFKYLLFDCEECGDCFLPENFGHCTMGGCEKGLANIPCGDCTADGRCGNNLERPCVGEKIYLAAAAEADGRERLRSALHPPRKTALQHTSSILNYLFARDHTMPNALISIGESIHASIPKTGAVMKQLHALGERAYREESRALKYVHALIASQAEDGADYIAVNVDAFGESDPQLCVDLMVTYVDLVRQWGGGVPVCIDSSDDHALIAGLKAWYDTDQPVKPPLVNSIKTYTLETLMPLRAEYPFSFVGLLVSEEAAAGPGGSYSVDQLVALAEQLFSAATERYGFQAEEIFFDSTVFPLAIDMPMTPDTPGYTYRAFETIKRIKQDARMKGVHCSLGISNSVRDLPGRRIGVCRAYVAKAMEYGLDAGIVNVAHHYGTIPPDPELLEMVDAFARLDGSAESLNRAIAHMSRFCEQNRKPPQ
jgi:methylenetetrahydrofolate reductase (NADPH)